MRTLTPETRLRYTGPDQLTWREKIDSVLRACRRVGARRAWVIGSAARGTPDEGSDLDLVVEKETAARAIDRLGEFLDARDRFFPLDVLVYTPEELAELLDAGQPFLTDAMQDARLIWADGRAVVDSAWVARLDASTEKVRQRNAAEDRAVADWMARQPEIPWMFNPSASAQDWLRQAGSDLASARILRDAGQHAAACFHAQQSGEKAVKAFLIRTGDRRVDEHGVGALTARAQVRDGRFGPLLADATVLDRFYAQTRYPDAWPGGAVPAERYFAADSERAIGIAERLRQTVDEIVKELDGPES